MPAHHHPSHPDGGNAAADTAASASSIDPAPLDMLRSIDPDGARRLVHRTITKFIDYCDESLLAFADVIGKQQVAEISRMAHSLKSSSASLGAIELSRQCAEIERLTGDGDLPEDIDERLAALQAAHRSARRDLLRMIERGVP